MEREQCFGCNWLDVDFCLDQSIKIEEVVMCEAENANERETPISTDEQEEEPDLSELWPDGLTAEQRPL